MTNTMSDDRERLLKGDWIVYNDVEGENFDLPSSMIAILTEKQRDKMVFNNVEPERIPNLETYDLSRR
jgi:asparagine synthetase A